MRDVRAVWKAKAAWLEQAQVRLDGQLGAEERLRIQSEAAEKLTLLQSEIEAINEALHVDIGGLDLPEVVVPEPELPESSNGLPLIDSTWDWVEQTIALKQSKDYEP